MMKGNRIALFLSLLFAVLMLCRAGFTVSEAAPSSGGEVVLDAESGRVLAERNAEKKMPMASSIKRHLPPRKAQTPCCFKKSRCRKVLLKRSS